jgi:hypothetical protein
LALRLHAPWLLSGQNASAALCGGDSFYGEDEGFKQSLSELGVGYVVALKPSHAWWHKIGEIGSPYEATVAACEECEDEKHPGEWVKVVRLPRSSVNKPRMH